MSAPALQTVNTRKRSSRAAPSEANFFFLAAGLAALGTGLLPIRLNVLVTIGAVDLLTFYGRVYGPLYPFVVLGTAAAWVLALVVMGFAARGGHRGAFLAGIVLYGLDMIALIVTFSFLAFGVHAFFLSGGSWGRRHSRTGKKRHRRPLPEPFNPGA